MRIVSFNVNGLRSILEKCSLEQFLASFDGADIICLQETKINSPDKLTVSLAAPADYYAFYSFHDKHNLLEQSKGSIGYSGVVTFVKKSSFLGPSVFEEGFTGSQRDSGDISSPLEHFQHVPWSILRNVDAESRCVITHHHHFILINTYCPNDSGDEARQQFRKMFYELLWKRCLTLLHAGKSIIWLGDINICYHPRDHCDYCREYDLLCDLHGENVVEEGILLYVQSITGQGSSPPPSVPAAIVQYASIFYTSSKPLRQWLYSLLYVDPEARKYHLMDTFRALHPTQRRAFSCWNTLTNARAGNYGSRIDFIFSAGPAFQTDVSIIREAKLMTDIQGSDHCPVCVDIHSSLIETLPASYPVAIPWNTKHLLQQTRLSSWFNSAVLKSSDIATGVRGSGAKVTPPQQPSNDIKEMPRKRTIDAYFSNERASSTSTASTMLTYNLGSSERIVDEEVVDLISSDEEDIIDDAIDKVCTQDSSITVSTPSEQSTKKVSRVNRPFCRRHHEPCTAYTVNKKGPNRGRRFYLCSRPVGDSKDPSARCDHFEWESTNTSLLSMFLKQS